MYCFTISAKQELSFKYAVVTTFLLKYGNGMHNQQKQENNLAASKEFIS
jgi:hypothetical protein